MPRLAISGFKRNWGAVMQIVSRVITRDDRRRSHLPLVQGSRRSGSKPSIVAVLPEQAELRGIARGLSEAEMAEGVRGQQAPARGALQIAHWIRYGSMMSSIASRGSDNAAAMVSTPTGPPP